MRAKRYIVIERYFVKLHVVPYHRSSTVLWQIRFQAPSHLTLFVTVVTCTCGAVDNVTGWELFEIRLHKLSDYLTFTTLWANSTNDKLMIFFLFFPENRNGYFMQIAMKYQILFSEENKETYFKLSSADFFLENRICFIINANCPHWSRDNLFEMSNPVFRGK